MIAVIARVRQTSKGCTNARDGDLLLRPERLQLAQIPETPWYPARHAALRPHAEESARRRG
jgi:hypothetical protein